MNKFNIKVNPYNRFKYPYISKQYEYDPWSNKTKLYILRIQPLKYVRFYNLFGINLSKYEINK